MSWRSAVATALLAAQGLWFAYEQTTPTRYFCWAPLHEHVFYRVEARSGDRRLNDAEVASRYGEIFMRSMAKPATIGKQVNVMQHMAGYFKESLPDDEKSELHDAIRDYRQRLVPLVVPLTLLRHHVRKLEVTYLEGQTHLMPHPKELMLRNHV